MARYRVRRVFYKNQNVPVLENSGVIERQSDKKEMLVLDSFLVPFYTADNFKLPQTVFFENFEVINGKEAVIHL